MTQFAQEFEKELWYHTGAVCTPGCNWMNDQRRRPIRNNVVEQIDANYTSSYKWFSCRLLIGSARLVIGKAGKETCFRLKSRKSLSSENECFVHLLSTPAYSVF